MLFLSKDELVIVFTKVTGVEEVARTVPFSEKVSATAGDRGDGISGRMVVKGQGEVVTFSRSEDLCTGVTAEAMLIESDAAETAKKLGAIHMLPGHLVDGLVPIVAKAKDFVEVVRH